MPIDSQALLDKATKLADACKTAIQARADDIAARTAASTADANATLADGVLTTALDAQGAALADFEAFVAPPAPAA